MNESVRIDAGAWGINHRAHREAQRTQRDFLFLLISTYFHLFLYFPVPTYSTSLNVGLRSYNFLTKDTKKAYRTKRKFHFRIVRSNRIALCRGEMATSAYYLCFNTKFIKPSRHDGVWFEIPSFIASPLPGIHVYLKLQRARQSPDMGRDRNKRTSSWWVPISLIGSVFRLLPPISTYLPLFLSISTCL